MAHRVRWANVFLAVAMAFTMGGPGFFVPSETARADAWADQRASWYDSQDEIIRQVLEASLQDVGYDAATLLPPKVSGGGDTWQYSQWAPPDDDPPISLAITACSTEQAAAADLDSYLSDSKSRINSDFEPVAFHGCPAWSYTESYEGNAYTSGRYVWQSGRFWFYVYVNPADGVNRSAEGLYANAQKYELVSGDGSVPAQDSDSDGVTDDMDQCPGTPAGVAVDDSGCPLVVEMSVTVSTDKPVYSAGDTVVISCSVVGSNGGLDGASLVFDVNGSPVVANADASGSYTFSHGLAADIADGVYTAKVTASHADYPDAASSTTFIVGDMGLLIEQNPLTGKPFVGVAADGVSTLKISISLPGGTDVRVDLPDIGELEGDSVSGGGTITLDSAGQAEFMYLPPDYLKKEQLGEHVDVHQSGVHTFVARIPLVVTYTDASGKEGTLRSEILVCRPPVMLVHGFIGSTATWGKMSTNLRGERFDTFLGNYLLQGHSIEQLSAVLQSDIAQQKLDYGNANFKLTKVDAVGHSMGGLISRYYANGLPGYSGDLRKLIMVGTPNHGVSWIRKSIGGVASNFYNTHKIPGEQLYSESPFMKALNAGETTGAHLNTDVQYGNIFGFPDDWVVSAGSAYLNGVRAVSQSDVKHSPDIPGVPSVAITENVTTWKQVEDWLLGDIYRPALRSSHAEVFKYVGDVYIDKNIAGTDTTKLSSQPVDLEPFQVLRTGPQSTAIVHLTIQDVPWGIIFLDPDSEILLGYYSPQLVEVRMQKGSASFRSRQDGHFSALVKIEGSGTGEWWKTTPQAVVTGLDTEFSISAGTEIAVHCFEGKLVVHTPEATNDGPVVTEGESVAVNGETVAAIAGVSAEDFWWSAEEDDFLDEGWGGGLLDRLKNLIASLVNLIKSLFG